MFNYPVAKSFCKFALLDGAYLSVHPIHPQVSSYLGIIDVKQVCDNRAHLVVHIPYISQTMKIIYLDTMVRQYFKSRWFGWVHGSKLIKCHWKSILDLLRKSGEFFVVKEDLDDQTEAANEGI